MRSLSIESFYNSLFILSLLLVFTNCQPSVETSGIPKSTLSLVKKWESDSVLTTAESVLFDAREGIFFVSCIGNVPPSAKDGDGFISKVAYYGNVVEEKWVTGLNAPKGMGSVEDTLYVADIDEIVKINKPTGEIIDRIPIAGSIFLNDITVDNAGDLFVSDTEANKIFRIKGDSIETFLEDEEMGGPNGLYAEANRIMVATFGRGNFSTIDLNTREMTPRTDSLPAGDGVVKIDEGYLVSNWNGEVYHVDENWEKTRLLDTRNINVNAADIEVLPEENLLLVPTFFGNSVVAYEIRRGEI